MGDAAILFCFAFLFIAAAGPGAWSVDGARYPLADDGAR
jgi:putative oxidoreductase